MKNILVLLLASFFLATAQAAEGTAATAQGAVEALAEKYSFAQQVSEGAATPAADVASPLPAANDLDRKYAEDRVQERDFKLKVFVIVSVAALLLSLIGIVVLFRLPAPPSSADIVHIVSLALIILGVLALTMTPTTVEVLTAPIGILGALAGYVFGQTKTGRAAPTPKGSHPAADPAADSGR